MYHLSRCSSLVLLISDKLNIIFLSVSWINLSNDCVGYIAMVAECYIETKNIYISVELVGNYPML